MKSGQPTVVLNPYDWLPGYGENRVEVLSKGLDWHVEIEYDNVAQAGFWRRNLCFKGVCCIYQASFPGPSLLMVDCPSEDTIGSLVEYPESEAARSWMEHFGDGRAIKHFGIVFLYANLVIQIFAQSVELSDPILV